MPETLRTRPLCKPHDRHDGRLCSSSPAGRGVLLAPLFSSRALTPLRHEVAVAPCVTAHRTPENSRELPFMVAEPARQTATRHGRRKPSSSVSRRALRSGEASTAWNGREIGGRITWTWAKGHGRVLCETVGRSRRVPFPRDTDRPAHMARCPSIAGEIPRSHSGELGVEFLGTVPRSRGSPRWHRRRRGRGRLLFSPAGIALLLGHERAVRRRPRARVHPALAMPH